MLTVEDEFTRESLAIEVGGSLPAARVLLVLERLFEERGVPQGIRSDNGPEFVALAVKLWLAGKGVHTHFIEPGSPWQNGIAESFNGKLRTECLNREWFQNRWFQNRAHAAALVARYRRYYNEERPHSSLNYLTPVEFRQDYE
ncbi:integrase core domain-containing protein, partial [Xanthomonas citri pv. citri]